MFGLPEVEGMYGNVVYLRYNGWKAHIFYIRIYRSNVRRNVML
jgi:hypothetical protein